MRSFGELSPENLVLTAVKKAEDSEAWIFQWYDAEGKEAEAILTLPQSPRKVFRSNILEEDGESVPFEKKTVKILTKKNAMMTIKVFF